MTIPQIAIPVTIGGKPYLVEIDEYSSGESGGSVAGNGPRVGAARIIDISDERRPFVVSNIRLAVHQPENRAAIAGDPGRAEPRPGLRRPLLQRPAAGGAGDPGLLDDRVRAAGVRHPRSRAPEGDRLPRRPAVDRLGDRRADHRRARELRDVAAGVRARARRDLVLGRHQRLLRAAHGSGRVAVPRVARRRRVRGERRVRLGVGAAARPARRAVLHAPRRVAGAHRRRARLRPRGPARRTPHAARSRGGRTARASTSCASRWRATGACSCSHAAPTVAFDVRPPHGRRASCDLVRSFRLRRPVFGGGRRWPAPTASPPPRGSR